MLDKRTAGFFRLRLAILSEIHEVSMRANMTLAAAAAVLLSSMYAGVGAQAPPPQNPPAQTPPAGGRAGAPGRGGQSFPKTMRPPDDPAVVERGSALYGINCRLCHGPDLRGGDMGGINLLRSQLVLKDENGELIFPVVRDGRNNPGLPPMPPLPLKEDDVKAIAAYIHSVLARSPGQGGPPPGPPVVLNILVGDAAAGQRFFAANCASCHSPTGDLQGLASRYSDPVQLQNTWIGGRAAAGGGRGGPGAAPGRAPKPVTVTVTTASGERVEGTLSRIDDFIVILTQADGTQRTFRRSGATPQVQVTDPLEGHRKLLVKYSNKDIHDVTAYLVTLK
jgi:cytochrome c oxidase cbb3-type subunit III